MMNRRIQDVCLVFLLQIACVSAHGEQIHFQPTDNTIYCRVGDTVAVAGTVDPSDQAVGSYLRLDGRTIRTGDFDGSFEWLAQDPGPHSLRVDFKLNNGFRTKGTVFPVYVLESAPIALNDINREMARDINLKIRSTGTEFTPYRIDVFVDNESIAVTRGRDGFRCKIPVSTLPEGHHDLLVEAYDSSGDRYEMQDAGLDTPARISIVSPGHVIRDAASDRLLVTPSFCAGLTPSRVDYSIKTTQEEAGIKVFEADTAPFMARIDMASLDSGDYYLDATVTDTAGHTYTAGIVPFEFTNRLAEREAAKDAADRAAAIAEARFQAVAAKAKAAEAAARVEEAEVRTARAAIEFERAHPKVPPTRIARRCADTLKAYLAKHRAAGGDEMILREIADVSRNSSLVYPYSVKAVVDNASRTTGQGVSGIHWVYQVNPKTGQVSDYPQVW
ncbi:MAG: hypothetical protein ACLQVD_16030 [Capsulimonadaceae bacterium]